MHEPAFGWLNGPTEPSSEPERHHLILLSLRMSWLHSTMLGKPCLSATSDRLGRRRAARARRDPTADLGTLAATPGSPPRPAIGPAGPTRANSGSAGICRVNPRRVQIGRFRTPAMAAEGGRKRAHYTSLEALYQPSL